MTKRVLIVDDRSTIRSIFAKILSQRPDLEICGEAEDGLEAIQKAKLLKPDLVLLDVSMPMMSGIEVASVLRKFLPSMAIILVTMHGERIGKSLASAVGVDAVLAKQDGATGLLGAVDRALASKSPVAPIIEAHLEPGTLATPTEVPADRTAAAPIVGAYFETAVPATANEALASRGAAAPVIETHLETTALERPNEALSTDVSPESGRGKSG